MPAATIPMEINCEVDSNPRFRGNHFLKIPHQIFRFRTALSISRRHAVRPSVSTLCITIAAAAQIMKSPAAEISCVGISFTPFGAIRRSDVNVIPNHAVRLPCRSSSPQRSSRSDRSPVPAQPPASPGQSTAIRRLLFRAAKPG